MGTFTIRLDDNDRVTIEAAAKVVGWPVGTFVRRAALAVAGRHLDPPGVNIGGALLILTEDGDA